MNFPRIFAKFIKNSEKSMNNNDNLKRKEKKLYSKIYLTQLKELFD